MYVSSPLFIRGVSKSVSLSLVSRPRCHDQNPAPMIIGLEISEPFARFSPQFRQISVAKPEKHVSKSVSLSLVSRHALTSFRKYIGLKLVSKSVSLSLVSRRTVAVSVSVANTVTVVSKSVSLSLVSRRAYGARLQASRAQVSKSVSLSLVSRRAYGARLQASRAQVSKSVSLSLVSRPLRPRGLTVDAKESVDSPAHRNKLIFHGVTSHALKNVEKVKNFSCERPTFFNIHFYNILNLKSSQKFKMWRISPAEGPKFTFTHFQGFVRYHCFQIFITI